MKYAYLPLLFLAAILLAAPTHAAPQKNITGYVLSNNTLVFNDGTSMTIPVVTPTVKPKTPALKYPVPHWMPEPFDGTAETCKMGVIGKNWKGDAVCYRRRTHPASR